MIKNSMMTIGYGISSPEDLFQKLERDAAKIANTQSPDDLFNFFVTANSLSDWIEKHHNLRDMIDPPFQKGKVWIIPSVAETWVDISRIPGKTGGSAAVFHIKNVLSLCGHVANASKHFNWAASPSIQIETNPLPANWYQFFTYQPDAGLCVDIDGFRYSIEQISHIVTSFYRELLKYLK